MCVYMYAYVSVYLSNNNKYLCLYMYQGFPIGT